MIETMQRPAWTLTPGSTGIQILVLVLVLDLLELEDQPIASSSSFKLHGGVP